MTGILGAFIGALGFSSANIIIKKSLSLLSIPQVLFMSTFSGMILFAIFTFFTSGFGHVSLQSILISAALACAEVILYLVLYKAFEKSNVGVASAISGTYPLLSTLFVIIVFSQQVSLLAGLCILSLVFGAILMSIDWQSVMKNGFSRADFTKGFGWIITITCLEAVYFPLLGQFTSTGSWQEKLLFIKIFSTIVIILFFAVFKKERILPPKEKIPFTSLLGLAEVIGWAGYSWASHSIQGQTAVLIAILNSSSLMTAIQARLFLKERLSKIQYVAIVIIVLALTGLTLLV